jgi:hypothetical protein
MESGCNISLLDFYGGHLKSGMPENATYWTDAPPINSNIGDFRIVFECRTNQQSHDAANLYGGRWDVHSKRWIPYYKNSREQRLASPVSRIYQVQSRNAAGFLRTTDQINGEESQRVRFYTFCLFHMDKAVCGDGQSRFLTEPSGDYLPYILRILRSVEFTDAPPETGKITKP